MAGLVVEDGTGLNNSNSYVSTNEVTTYAQGRLYAAEWAALDADAKDQAARNATSIIEDLIAWYGARVVADQALGWPRSGVSNKENSDTFDDDIVPQPVKDATCELAIQLAKYKLIDQPSQTIKSMSVTGMTVSMENRDSGSFLDPIPTTVYNKIAFMGELRIDVPSFSLSRKLWG